MVAFQGHNCVVSKWRAPPGWLQLRAATFARYGHRCHWCGAYAASVDHLIAVCLGGSHDLANLRPACISCNSRNGAKIGNHLRGRRVRLRVAPPSEPFKPSRDW